MKKLVSASLLAAGLALAGAVQAAPVTLLNVSYDVMRDFYKDYNAAFQKHWEAEHPNDKLTLQMSFGGSSKQARSVIDGLPADVITMNMATDINALADKLGAPLVATNDVRFIKKEDFEAHETREIGRASCRERV